MILHVFESGRHLAAPKLWATWSAAMHAAVVAGAVGGAYGHAAEPPTPEERVRYVLPQLPAPAAVQPLVLRVPWRGHGPGDQAGVARPAQVPRDLVGAPADKTAARAGGGAPPPAPLAAVDSDSGTGVTVRLYLADGVDTPVERDAASDGPKYPESLQALGMEGAVGAEWVVDSTGRADAATFRALEATHPLFADAVREALPRMLFRPAVAAGRPVAQLVRQRFQFRIAPPAPPTPPAPPAAPPA